MAHIKNIRIVLPALVSGLVLSAVSFRLDRPETLYFQVRMSSSVASTSQIFFNVGRGENEQDSDYVTLAPSAELRTYRFRVPSGEVLQGMRFDALDGEGQVRIASGSFITSSGTVLRQFLPADFLPRYQFVKTGEDLGVATFASARSPGQAWDPMLSIRLDQPIRTSVLRHTGRTVLLAIFVLLASSFLIGLLIAAGTPDLYYRLAVYWSIFFQIVHFAALPPFVSYDGMQYSYLARLLFTPSFSSGWDFQRTPMLPFLLRIAFLLGGDQPESAILPSMLFGAGGILLLGSVVRQVAGKTYGAAALIVLTFYPYVVGYQHIVLTEIGTFFMFALLLWSLLRVSCTRNRNSLIYPIQIALVLALGFYQRPTFIYIAPLICIFYILLVTAPDAGGVSYATLWCSLRLHSRSILPRAAVILVVPWLLCWPWRALAGGKIGTTADRAIGIGMTRQAMIPPDDPRLGSLGVEYGRVIKETMSDGGFHPDGLGVGAHFPMFLAMSSRIAAIGPMRLIRDYPWRYVTGWFRTMVVYMGYPREPVDCENTMFSRALFTGWPADYTLEKTLGWNVKYDAFLPPVYTGGAALGQFLASLIPVYSSLLLASSWISLFWLLLSLRKPDPVAIAMAGVPLGFLAIHALTLFSASRYSFPTYPLFLANLICVGHSVEQSLRRFVERRSLGPAVKAAIDKPTIAMSADSGRMNRMSLAQIVAAAQKLKFRAWPYCLAAGIVLLAGRYDWSAGSSPASWRGFLTSAFFLCITLPIVGGTLDWLRIPQLAGNITLIGIALILTLPYRWLGLNYWYYYRNKPLWLDWKLSAPLPRLSWFPQAFRDPPQIPGELLFFVLLTVVFLGAAWLVYRAGQHYKWPITPLATAGAAALAILIVGETWMHISVRSPYTYICHFEQPASANYWYQVNLFPTGKGAVNADYFVFRALEDVFLGTPAPLNGMLIRRPFPFYLSSQFSYFFNPYYVMIAMNVTIWVAASLAVFDFTRHHVGLTTGIVAAFLTASAPGFIMYVAQPQTYLWGYSAVALVIWAHWRLCGGGAKLSAYVLFGGILALGLLTYDLFAVVVYLLGYESLYKGSVKKLLVSLALAAALYVGFGALSGQLHGIIPDDANNKYLSISIKQTFETLASNPLTTKDYPIYAGLLSTYAQNLANAVFVFPLLIAIAGLFMAGDGKVVRLLGLLALPSFLSYAILYFGRTYLATFPRFVFTAYPAVYIGFGVAVERIGRRFPTRFAIVAIAAVAVGLHIILVNADVFGHPWLYYLFYRQAEGPNFVGPTG